MRVIEMNIIILYWIVLYVPRVGTGDAVVSKRDT